MPHRRKYGSKKMFEDGEYFLQSSASDLEEMKRKLALYTRICKPGVRLRYLLGEDGVYYLYNRIELVEE